ncbi:AAA family ATPase [Sciscionella marina]|uniref:AAA family ATPase n=1 Tax=Sciscionella marina TaxID=508770 RepID=UPI0003620497|nr:AAA family ATPase [Sciscionella marina]
MHELNPAERFFVVTGGPGSGKTTLLDRLRQGGFDTTMEAGRGTIQAQVAIGGQVSEYLA